MSTPIIPQKKYIRHMFLHFFLQSALVILSLMTILFLVAIWLKDNSIIDSFWGLGILIISVFTLIASSEITGKKVLLTSLVAIWSLRLSIHIFLRNRKHGEDFRYAAWRKQWKFFYLRSYFQVFLLQGCLMLLVASPIILVNSSPAEHTGLIDCIGTVIFLSGFIIESIADLQLYRFKQLPENVGNLMTSGAWRFSRHPNYFGEALLWFGIWIIAIPEVDGLFTIVSPVLMALLLRYVSGVPMLEKKYEGREDWEKYKKDVPPFIPHFRK
jgi:steroid 5-alpha reductase family enzyme